MAMSGLLPLTAEQLKTNFKEESNSKGGQLEFRELSELLRRGNPNITDTECRLLFELCDANRGGSVTFEEFVDFLHDKSVYLERPVKPQEVPQLVPRKKHHCGYEIEMEEELTDQAKNGMGQTWEDLAGAGGRSKQDFPPAVCRKLLDILELRDRFLSGVASAEPAATAEQLPTTVFTGACPTEVADVFRLARKTVRDPSVRAFCRTRLGLLEAQMGAYKLENRDEEHAETRQNHADFNSIPKVDTHLHASAIMSAKQLCRFMDAVYKKDKDRKYGDSTLGEAMQAAGYSGSKGADMDKLGVKGSYLMFHNFSNFNAAFAPLQSRDLKKIFFGTEALEGEYLFRIIEQSAAIAQLDNIFLEPRFSIYGRDPDEWVKLARWVRRWRLNEVEGILIAVQLPRVYSVWRRKGMVGSFGDLLRNFWQPLFDTTLRPEDNPELAWFFPFLRIIDTVDDESTDDAFDFFDLPAPDYWTSEENPPYSYYHYYMHVNLARLKALWQSRSKAEDAEGFALTLRPHCGEAGPTHHLLTAFILCRGVSHGIQLDQDPALQYLYYLAQVPIAVSPISNSVLFLKYCENPFPRFLHRGLCVALTTDDPLMFHTTPTPVLEEYATARHAFDLDDTDLAEVARNSCIAAFSDEERSVIHGDDNPHLTNIPPRRLLFRAHCLAREWNYMRSASLPPK